MWKLICFCIHSNHHPFFRCKLLVLLGKKGRFFFPFRGVVGWLEEIFAILVCIGLDLMYLCSISGMKVQVFPDWFVDLIPWIFGKGRIPTNTNEMKWYLKNSWSSPEFLLRPMHMSLYILYFPALKWVIFPNLSNPNPGVIYAHLSVLAFLWLIIAPQTKKNEERWKEDFHLRSTLKYQSKRGFFRKKKRFTSVSRWWTFVFLWGMFLAPKGNDLNVSPKKRSTKSPDRSLTKKMTGWWFQRIFMFTPIWRRFPIWRAYVSKGLKPPSRWV